MQSMCEVATKVAMSGSVMPSQCNSLSGYTVPRGTSNGVPGKHMSKKKLKKNLQKERRKGN